MTGEAMASAMGSRLPPAIASRLKLPLIAAPMLRVSGPELVIAACRQGVIGAFPTLNPGLCEPAEGLDDWLARIVAGLDDAIDPAPFCPNIVMRSPDLDGQVAALIRHGTEIVITSVGSPKPILPQLKDGGITVLADVATVDHAKKAIDAGVDGLVLLTAGAGGQTGWLNGFAFARAVRGMFDGPIILAGGICDGASLRAAEVLGCDLGYMGTKFIATSESMASDLYRARLVEDTMDDIVLTRAFNGLWGNFMRSSITAAGLDPDMLDEQITAEKARADYGSQSSGRRRWSDLTSAGHSISGVHEVQTVAALIETVAREYHETKLAI